MRQLIIVRKDLDMSPGKLSAQVSHASMAFISNLIQRNTRRVCDNGFVCRDEDDKMVLYKRQDLYELSKDAFDRGDTLFFADEDEHGRFHMAEKPKVHYKTSFVIDNDIYTEWFKGIFTKTVCEAKNRNQLMKAVTMAEDLGLKEGEDFFLIKDSCLTELTPEEVDENGVGRTLTCIGFKPLPDDIAHSISKKYQLYK